MKTTPRIYVACLSSYNAGVLHGAWIDAAQDADAIHAEIAAMLATSRHRPAEEWAIHDHENFGGCSIAEHESIENIARLAGLMETHGEVAGALYAYDTGSGLDRVELLLTDGYHGEWETFEDYADNFLEDTGAYAGMNETLRGYFDLERFARDLEHDYVTIRTSDGKIHVFDGSL